MPSSILQNLPPGFAELRHPKIANAIHGPTVERAAQPVTSHLPSYACCSAAAMLPKSRTERRALDVLGNLLLAPQKDANDVNRTVLFATH